MACLQTQARRDQVRVLDLGLQSQNVLIECRDRRPQFGNAREQLLHESHDDQPEVARLRRLPLDQILIEQYQFGGCGTSHEHCTVGDGRFDPKCHQSASMRSSLASRASGGNAPFGVRYRIRISSFPELDFDASNSLAESEKSFIGPFRLFPNDEGTRQHDSFRSRDVSPRTGQKY